MSASRRTSAGRPHRFAQAGDQVVGQGAGLRGIVEPGRDHGELVAAEPRQGVRSSEGGAHAPGHGGQQGVPRLVAERVVDALEPVQVGEQDAHDRPLAGERLAQPGVQQGTVRQTRQVVVGGAVAQQGVRARPPVGRGERVREPRQQVQVVPGESVRFAAEGQQATHGVVGRADPHSGGAARAPPHERLPERRLVAAPAPHHHRPGRPEHRLQQRPGHRQLGPGERAGRVGDLSLIHI